MSFSRSLVFSALIIALSLAYPSVNAGEYLDEDIEESLEDFYGDEDFVSIATGSRKLLTKAPSVATVITAERIKNMGARNLIEVLDSVPGLHAARNGQNMVPEFWFRGIATTYTPQTLFMINGVSTKSSVRGDNHIMWGEFPIHAIERLEVIRGPGSALYGADAFSGVINVITKKGNTLSSNEIGAKMGSFDTKNIWANSHFTLSNWQISANIEYLESDGHKRKISSDAQSIIDKVGADLSAPAVSLAPGSVNMRFKALDLWLSASNSSFEIDLGLQERSDIGTGQGATEVVDPKGQGGGYKRIASFNLKEQPIFYDTYLAFKASHYSSNQDIEENYILFPEGAFFGSFPNGFIGNPGWEEETNHLQLNIKNHTFSKTELLFGLGYERQNLYQVTESKNFNPDFTPRANGLEDVSDTAEIYMPEADRESRFAFIQAITQLAPDWELTAGARYDDYSDFGSTFNPRLALVWSTSLNLSTKLLFGRAFRAPSFAELLTINNPVSLGNSELTPETIDTYELAFDYKPTSDLSLQFNLYHYKIDDLITFVPDSGQPTATAQNQGKRKGYGVEANIQLQINNNLIQHANIAFTRANDDILNKDVGEYPRLQAYSRTEWVITEHFKLNAQLSYIANRKRVVNDTRDNIGDYWLFNLSSIYQFEHLGLRIEASINNLLDQDIREPSSASTTFDQINLPNDIPQAGRSFNIALTKTF